VHLTMWFGGRSSKQQIPPLRFASVGMTWLNFCRVNG
jgi:hypothetical protein